MESFELDGIGEIKVRRSANIKYLSIRMSPGRGVWVNVPYGVSGRQMIRFVEEKKEWINELNVFPVPDGDTGTYMTMTIMAAATAAQTARAARRIKSVFPLMTERLPPAGPLPAARRPGSWPCAS